MVTRLLLLLCVILAVAAPAAAQSTLAYPGPQLRDEGADQGRLTHAINFTGAGVSCTWSAGVGTCTITGGGGGGANTVEASIAMTAGAGVYSTTVTGQAWVAADSEIVCAPFGTTADGLTVEQVAAANVTITVANRVAGVGFDVFVFNPFGSHGTHRVHCTGA
jgi:hypothetical protein